MRIQHGFVHNMKQNKFVINATLKAKQILDHCVTLPIAKHKPIIIPPKTTYFILCIPLLVSGYVVIACGL